MIISCLKKWEKKLDSKSNVQFPNWDEAAAVYLMTLGSYKTPRQHSSGQIKKYNCDLKTNEKENCNHKLLELDIDQTSIYLFERPI